MKTDLTDANISQKLSRTIKLLKVVPVMGGSINNCYLAEVEKGPPLFFKTHRGNIIPGMYAAESKSLQLLAEPGTLCVPNPVYFDEDWLIMDAFRTGAAAPDWQERMGRGLALLHQATKRNKFGFSIDNYLGTSLQGNTWQDNWLSFWGDQRLGYQLRLFSQHAQADDPLLQGGARLLDQLEDILACGKESAVLLHGDLWSGNAAANDKGEPVIFDPASYYGHREAEFGMMRLFGGFGPECEAAYQEVWPFQPGFDRRIEVYRLYHQLNHLNLFGSSYYEACLATIKNLL
jgi:protein-ribulosamine 3-kinase